MILLWDLQTDGGSHHRLYRITNRGSGTRMYKQISLSYTCAQKK